MGIQQILTSFRHFGKSFINLFPFIYLYLEIIFVLLQVLDDIKIVPRVNHLLQPLLARFLSVRVDPTNLESASVKYFAIYSKVDPAHLRRGKSLHVVHHLAY